MSGEARRPCKLWLYVCEDQQKKNPTQARDTSMPATRIAYIIAHRGNHGAQIRGSAVWSAELRWQVENAHKGILNIRDKLSPSLPLPVLLLLDTEYFVLKQKKEYRGFGQNSRERDRGNFPVALECASSPPITLAGGVLCTYHVPFSERKGTDALRSSSSRSLRNTPRTLENTHTRERAL